MSTLLRVAWLELARDRAALALTFLLPLVFFSVTALIFARLGGGELAPIEVVVADEDESAESRRLLAAVVADPSLVGPGGGGGRRPPVIDRAAARARVEAGEVAVAIVVPRGFGDAARAADRPLPLVLLADPVADPVAHRVAAGVLQQIVGAALPEVAARRGVGLVERLAGGFDEEQRRSIDTALGWMAAAPGSGGPALQPAEVALEDVRREAGGEGRRQRVIAFQAAGIGVMFLLFSMTRAAGSLLREEATGTLERVLATGVGMGRLLAAYWLFATLLGSVQLTVMFVWGWALFGLDLWSPAHLAGFAVMTPVTAAAAAALGLVLGTACRSQAQLTGLSTILILLMSALGGSMVPRFVLRESPLMDALGLATFNGWAIDGFQKVFWYETGLASLWPQLAALAGMTVAFLAAARWLARRWEAE